MAQERTVAKAVAQFAGAGLVTLALVAGGTTLALRRIGKTDALNDARHLAKVTSSFVRPALTDDLVRSRPSAVAAMDRAVHTGVLTDPIVRVKIWDASGRIVYSDEARLIGSTYALGTDEHAILGEGGVQSDISDLSRPENRFDRSWVKLLEVYLPVRTPNGTPLLFETYMKYSSVAANARHIWTSLWPVLLVALVVLEILQLPLAWRITKRLQLAQQQRESALRRAMQASEVERRRVAADLHDGPLQELSAISLGLQVTGRSKGVLTDDARETLHRSTDELRRVMRQLRTLVVEIYPPNLERAGIAQALADLVAAAESRGVDARATVDDNVGLAPHIEALVYRAAQEAVRNVVAHADATRVDVSLRASDGHAVLRVVDDGAGFDVAAEPAGHFGLRLVRELAEEAGGRMAVSSVPGHGTTLEVEVPAA